MSGYYPHHVQPIPTWNDRVYPRRYQPAHGQRIPVRPTPPASFFPADSTPRQNTQARPTSGTWKQKRLADSRRAALQQLVPTSSPGNIIMPVADAVLRLYKDLSSCQRLCEEYQHTFDAYAGQLRSRVKDGTLDMVWRDLVASNDPSRFEEVVSKVTKRASDLEAVLGATRPDSIRCVDSTAGQDAEVFERRGRAATKALLQCDELGGLFKRARTERRACNLLVEELTQVTDALDPDKNPGLYRDAEDDEAGTVKERVPTRGREKGNGKGTRKGKTAEEGEAETSGWSTSDNNFDHSTEEPHAADDAVEQQ